MKSIAISIAIATAVLIGLIPVFLVILRAVATLKVALS
jgi:hypothetical protein